MDQPAHAKKDRLIDDPGLAEVIKPSRAFLRPDTVTGIDNARRHLLYASWLRPLHSVT